MQTVPQSYQNERPVPAVAPPVPDMLALATAAAAGQPLAQRQVFRMLKRVVHGTLYRIVGNNRNIEDLVQDSFIEIYRSLHNYRGDAKLTTWADRITVRVAYRHLRRRDFLLSDIEAAAVWEPAESRADAREGLRRLYAALNRLNPEQRVAFALFAIDGRSLIEVAAVTDVTVVTAKSRVWRARRALRKIAMQDPVLSSHLTDEEKESGR